MNEQRKAFEAWYVPLYGSVSLLGDSDQYTSGYAQGKWQAWEAAIASQAPRQALSDAEIGEIAENYKFKEHYRSNAEAIQFAKRVLAASGPNAALVAVSKDALAYLESVARKTGSNAVWERCDILCGEFRKALAAVGV